MNIANPSDKARELTCKALHASAVEYKDGIKRAAQLLWEAKRLDSKSTLKLWRCYRYRGNRHRS